MRAALHTFENSITSQSHDMVAMSTRRMEHSDKSAPPRRPWSWSYASSEHPGNWRNWRAVERGSNA